MVNAALDSWRVTWQSYVTMDNDARDWCQRLCALPTMTCCRKPSRDQAALNADRTLGGRIRWINLAEIPQFVWWYIFFTVNSSSATWCRRPASSAWIWCKLQSFQRLPKTSTLWKSFYPHFMPIARNLAPARTPAPYELSKQWDKTPKTQLWNDILSSSANETKTQCKYSHCSLDFSDELSTSANMYLTPQSHVSQTMQNVGLVMEASKWPRGSLIETIWFRFLLLSSAEFNSSKMTVFQRWHVN